MSSTSGKAGGALGSARGAAGPGLIPCSGALRASHETLGWPPRPSSPDGASRWASPGAVTWAEQGAAAERRGKGPPEGNADGDLGAGGQQCNGPSTFLKWSQVGFRPLPTPSLRLQGQGGERLCNRKITRLGFGDKQQGRGERVPESVLGQPTGWETRGFFSLPALLDGWWAVGGRGDR